MSIACPAAFSSMPGLAAQHHQLEPKKNKEPLRPYQYRVDNDDRAETPQLVALSEVSDPPDQAHQMGTGPAIDTSSEDGHLFKVRPTLFSSYFALSICVIVDSVMNFSCPRTGIQPMPLLRHCDGRSGFEEFD